VLETLQLILRVQTGANLEIPGPLHTAHFAERSHWCEGRTDSSRTTILFEQVCPAVLPTKIYSLVHRIINLFATPRWPWKRAQQTINPHKNCRKDRCSACYCASGRGKQTFN